MIKIIRIDHRLLHGQVIFAWTKSQGIERIIVIDNQTAVDDFKKMSLKLSKPADIKLSVFSDEQAIERMDKINALKDTTMIIFGNVAETAKVAPHFTGVTEINYGGIPERQDTKKYSNAIYLTPKEVKESQQLKQLGFKLYMQQVPTSKRESLNDVI
ncbi:MAG: PTS sugar transporter subunit IIB [Lactobacillus sp.]|uniref:PTS mannose/fructose/sorbose transporter subunit IIB n=1 Tax=Bombilactobacillus bombi TaxID=1303590 RepID=A0A3R6XXQ6_9LACO|nr:PTS sugar transporter subunit IIB [Bombilactobacillus bombi]MCO6543748.1 PTS sugar transporter subunit IIB [Lactobacillus sp.]RHW52365.1 PTS mannose/fructose/sorbose transporter subunit IIB [Bombilactobacillus bombi]